MKTEELIEDSVELVKNNYLSKMRKTKRVFFKCLQEQKSKEQFMVEFEKIWSDFNYKFMNNRVNELEQLIDEINKSHPSGETKQFFEMLSQSKFDSSLNKYENLIQKYYEERLSTINNGVEDIDAYLSNFVNKYTSHEAMIPYFNKDGTVHSWHNIADYNSMLFNVNLSRTALNRMLYDAEYLDKDLVYVPCHPCCHLCAQCQGKVYSISGKSKKYPSLDEAYSNGLGHPNCKHVPVIYWDNTQIQKEKYDSTDWKQKYETEQKKKAIKRELSNQYNDLKILKELDNQTKIDQTKNRIKKLRLRLSEL